MEAARIQQLTIRSCYTALRRAAEWYVARGTEGLNDVDAMRVRRLASWVLIFSVLLPVVIVAQFLRHQYTTAVVNIFYGVISVGCWEWALQGSQCRAARAMRAQRMIVATTVVDLVLTALLNGGINGSGLWYLALVPLLVVAPQRGTRETMHWTAATMVAVCLVALVDPHWPFVRDLEVEPVDVVVTMRLLLIMALGAFATTSVQAMDRYVAAIEEREARLAQRTLELAVAQDETDATRAILQRLRESEEQFRQLMAQAADALYVAREGGRIVEANRQACDILGYSREEILEHSVYDFDSMLDEVEVEQLLARIGANGHLAVERTLRRKDGSVFPVELRVSRIEIHGEEHFLLAARDITERKLGEEQLEQSHAQLRALSSRLLSVQEEERRHVAREVHDELGQVLTALSLDVGWLSTHVGGDTAAMEQIGKIGDRLDAAIGSVQRIGRELRPLLLDDLGLLAALEWLVREFQERTRIPCVLRAPADGFSLDRERDTTVFRLVQEALTNVARHAGASHVSVSLAQSCDAVRLTVDDDGRGIRQEEITRRDSLGLLGMRERVHMCGGAMTIRGDAGQGTHLEISIPLPGHPPIPQTSTEART